MTREWKPGDVALDKRGKRIFRHGDKWILPEPGFHAAKIASGWDTDDARPLVVIDPEDREQVVRFVRAYFDQFSRRTTTTYVSPPEGRHFDAAADALREFANPTPPKPPEPTGLGAVVEDDEGLHWVRIQTLYSSPWVRRGVVVTGGLCKWDDINAVRVLSEGVQA